MSAGDKPPKGPVKPFLAEEELSSELDAWDSMFDNLHESAPADAGLATADDPMAWPEPALDSAAVTASRVPEPALTAIDASHTLDDIAPAFEPRGENELEEQMTLERALDGEEAERPQTVPASYNDAWAQPDETDFSDVGAQGAPAALGEMLGGSGELPAFDDIEDVRATRLDVSMRPRKDEDEDEVYTSASRPDLLSPSMSAPLPDDPIAPPPKPATVKRTGPAIIRRQTPRSIAAQPEPKQTPQHGYPAQDPSDFGENTRIADVGQMQAKADESRRADRHKAPTAPPPTSFTPSAYQRQAPVEDDYEVEIGASSDDDAAPAPAPEATAQPRRTVANVIRRDPAKSPPAPIRRESEPIIEISRPDTSEPRGEDDFSDVAASFDEGAQERSTPSRAPSPEASPEDSFSDVAAAVGADALMDDLPMPSRRNTPVGIRPRSGAEGGAQSIATDGFAGPRSGAEGGAHAIDADIRAALDRTVAALKDRGATIVDVSLPHTHLALAAYYIVAPAEASSNLARYDGIRFGKAAQGAKDLIDLYNRSRGEGFGPEVKRRIMLGTYALRSGYYDAFYKKAQQVRALIKRDFDEAFTQCDVILTPTTPTAAFKFGAKASPIDMYLGDVFTLSCNLAGLPGMSVPCGLTSEQLPVGAQLLGKPLDEATVLRVGHVIEAQVGLGTQRPRGVS